MSHQPFETWILDEGTLPPADRRMLYEHLEGCPQCQRIQRRWLSVHQELRARRIIAPAPGFAHRWQASLAERRARDQRKQAWRIFGILLGAAMFVLLVLTGYLVATSTFSDWMDSFIRTLSSSRQVLGLIIYIGQTWLDNTPPALNIALWVYLTVALSLLSLVWVLILWRTSHVGVRNL